jgi:hypothetical protein
MTQLTLNMSGEQTVDAQNISSALTPALEALTETHHSDQTDVTVPSGALRWRDGGLWVRVQLEATAEAVDIEAAKQDLARVAAEAGVVDTVEAGVSEVDVRG